MLNRLLLPGFFQICILLLGTNFAHAQEDELASVDLTNLYGIWESEGTIMGKDGEGWVMPHKHSAPDCGKDHTIFEEDNTAKEVNYSEECAEKVKPFDWELDGETLLLTRGESTIKWHILHLDENTMRVGVQFRPNSEHKMYVAYKRKE